MSIRHSLLALLTEEPKYGFQLKREFEDRTGDLWPLNVGQVYTTLARLERDGLVVADAGHADDHRLYRLTSDGDDELRRWLETPRAPDTPSRNETVIKLALAPRIGGVDIHHVIQQHRRAALETLQTYTRLKASGDPDDIGWLAVIDAVILQTEAEVRWLDVYEARLRGARPGRRQRPPDGEVRRARRRAGARP